MFWQAPAPPPRPLPTVFSSVRQTSTTGRRRTRKTTKKTTWTGCWHGSITRWIALATRRISRGRGGGRRTDCIGLSNRILGKRETSREGEREREKERDENRPRHRHTNSCQAICVYAANNAEFERLERQEQACATYPNYRRKHFYTLSLGFMPKQTVRSRIHHGSRVICRNGYRARSRIWPCHCRRTCVRRRPEASPTRTTHPSGMGRPYFVQSTKKFLCRV